MQTWPRFLPPLYPLSVVPTTKRPTTVAEEFHREFVRMMTQGLKRQDEARGVYQHKLDLQGFSILETIHHHVRDEPALIVTQGQKHPHIQNACCPQRSMQNGVLSTLAENHPQITEYIRTSIKLAQVLRDTRYAEMPRLCCAKETMPWRPTTYPLVEMRESILRAVIHYLKLDESDPIPSVYKSVVTEKPEGYSPTWTDKEKWSFVENHWRKPQLMEILQLHQQPLIKMAITPKISWDHPLSDADAWIPTDTSPQGECEWKFKRFIKQEMDICSDQNQDQETSYGVHKAYTTIIHHFDAYFEQNTGEVQPLYELKKYLNLWFTSTWSTFCNDWMAYDNTLPMAKRKKLFATMEHMAVWTKWNVWSVENNSLKIRQFIREALHNITVLYPEMIRNQKVHGLPLPPRWDFAPPHYQDFSEWVHKKVYAHLEPFSSEDPDVLDPNAMEYTRKMIHLLDMFCPTMKQVDDELIELMYRFAWMATLYLQMTPSPFPHHDISLHGLWHTHNRRRAQLLQGFVEIEEDKKEMIDKTVYTLAKETNFTRTKEKERFTNLFKNLDKEGRKLMSEMKKRGIGLWSEGKEGLAHYNSQAYERERKADDMDFVEENDLVAPEEETKENNDVDNDEGNADDDGYDDYDDYDDN